MRKQFPVILILSVFFFLISSCLATDRLVPSQYSTIQAAIDASINGDTVIISPGTYTGSGNKDLDYGGKAITVRSTDPNNPAVVSATIIDCQQSGVGFYFHSGENSNSILAGLTITHGDGNYASLCKTGGIGCNSSSPTIYSCVITGNVSGAASGGIYITGAGSNPTISHCIIKDNHGFYSGAIYCDQNTNLTITNCIIAGNFSNYVDALGGGICCYKSGVNMSHCTIVDNHLNGSDSIGGGVYVWTGSGLNTSIKNCIIWGNSAATGSQIYGNPTTVSYSDVQGSWSGTGNINNDPCLFMANYHLIMNSPCINTGDPNFIPGVGEKDIDGDLRVLQGRTDIGADEYTGMPFILAQPALLTFVCNEAGINPQDQILSVYNIGNGTLNWQLSESCDWLSAEPNSGSSTGEIDDVNIIVNTSSLVYGTYNCNLTVSDPNAYNSPQIVSVNLIVHGPAIELSADEFRFWAVEGEPNPDARILGITNVGGGTLNWTATCDCNWMSIEPNTGSSIGETDNVNLSVNTSGLAAGTYTCELTVSDANASNSPQTVSVILIVADPAPIFLGYTAETNAYSHAYAFGSTIPGEGSDTDHDYSADSECHSNTSASANSFSWDCPQFQGSHYHQYSYLTDGVEGISDTNGISITSHMKGWGSWNQWNDCSGSSSSGSGGGDGNGFTKINGIIFGASGYAGILDIDAQIVGDAPYAWHNWNWWLKVWDNDVNNPLVVLNDSNMSASIYYAAYQGLNIEFYHEAGDDSWPQTGLESTIKINFNLKFGSPDIDENLSVDGIDFSILANDWRLQSNPNDPNWLAGDLTRDWFVNFADLWMLADAWMDCLVGHASSPEPATGATNVDPNVILSWTAGDGALEHDVYLGTNLNDVNNAGTSSPEFKGNQTATNYDPCGLDANTTYYFWRIDEAGPRCATKGDIWSFTTWTGSPDSNLAGWWQFDESAGTIAHDPASGNNGTVHGATWTGGQINGALDFDGIDDYVSVPDSEILDFNTGDLTVSLWIKPADLGDGGIVGKYDSWAEYNYAIWYEGGILYFEVGYSGETVISSTVVNTANQWYHIAGTYDHNYVKLYVNGQEVDSESENRDLGEVTGPLCIGTVRYDGTSSHWFNETNDYFNGLIDDTRIYDRALSAAEILQLYNEGLNP
jgi:hypothetical protein